MENGDNTEQNNFFLDLQKQKDTGITVRMSKTSSTHFRQLVRLIVGGASVEVFARSLPPSIGDQMQRPLKYTRLPVFFLIVQSGIPERIFGEDNNGHLQLLINTDNTHSFIHPHQSHPYSKHSYHPRKYKASLLRLLEVFILTLKITTI